jgi:hypothetical protein
VTQLEETVEAKDVAGTLWRYGEALHRITSIRHGSSSLHLSIEEARDNWLCMYGLSFSYKQGFQDCYA